MPPHQPLLDFAREKPFAVFDMSGLDQRGCLAYDFPAELPLLVSLKCYPEYERMLGENWMHWHDFYEFFVSLSGSGTFRIGKNRVPFAPGDFVLVNPLLIHGMLEMESDHTALVVHFPRYLVAGSGVDADRDFLSPWDRRSPDLQPVIPVEHDKATGLHRALLAVVRSWFAAIESATPGESAPWMRLKLDLLDLLLGFHRVVPRTRTPDLSDAERARREERLRLAVDYIARHAHEALTQPEVARASGMSVSRFREFFKATTGWGFAQFVREQRVKMAAKQLREGNDTVGTIAYQSGFSDQSHLQRCFKARYSISPASYRKKHRG